MSENLTPAAELARRSAVRFPNESDAYRAARTKLLAEEIELRRHIERVAELRRALPPGGEVTKDYRFQGERGEVGLADLFGGKQSLAVYSFMFGPQRERPCPMCTNLLGAWEGNAADIEQRMARRRRPGSPIERLIAGSRSAAGRTSNLRRHRRRSLARLSRRLGGGRRYSELQRLHPPRRDHPPFLGREMGIRDIRPGQTRAAPRNSPRSERSTPRRKAATRTGIQTPLSGLSLAGPAALPPLNSGRSISRRRSAARFRPPTGVNRKPASACPCGRW